MVRANAKSSTSTRASRTASQRSLYMIHDYVQYTPRRSPSYYGKACTICLSLVCSHTPAAPTVTADAVAAVAQAKEMEALPVAEQLLRHVIIGTLQPVLTRS